MVPGIIIGYHVRLVVGLSGDYKQHNKNTRIQRMPGPSKSQRNKAKKAAQRAGKQVIPKGTFAKSGGSIGGSLGKFAGSALGLGKLGTGVGQALGGLLGNGLSKLVGFGDYRVESNSLYKEGGKVPIGDTIPAFGVRGHAVTVKHCEYVTDIVVPAVPADFSLTSYRINPGNSAMFPWLASVATNFQQFRIVGMVIEFRSLSGDVSAGGALGSVSLATDYNALAPDFVDKLHMENSEYAVSTKPSQSQFHTIECARNATANELLYVRNNTSSSTVSQDPRLYDLGIFQLATKGLPGSAGEVLGELWVSYDVELLKPLVVDETYNSGRIRAVTGVTTALTFGTDPVEYGTICTAENDDLDFNRAGEFLVVGRFTGTGIADAPQVSMSGTGSVVEESYVYNGGGLDVIGIWTVTVTAGETMVFDSSAFTTLTLTDVRIAPYNFDLS